MAAASNLFRPAAKRRRPARVALCGPTGSGKTRTAMIAMDELCGPGNWGIIDTERDSALDYADIHDFVHASLTPPYSPQRYVERIQAAAAAELPGLIIDSLTHGWSMQGGILEMVDKAKARHGGNAYAAWSEGTPAQNELIDAMLAFPGHLFVTMRSKMDHVQEKDERTGNTTIKKVGMAPIQRDGVEYEFQVVCDIDIHHQLVVSKTRCVLLKDAVVTEPDGLWWRTLSSWLDSGKAPADPAVVAVIVEAMNVIADEGDRLTTKRLFIDCFGKPDLLTADQVDEANSWVKERSAELGAPPMESAGDTGEPDDAGDGVPVGDSTEPDPEAAPAADEPVGEPADHPGGDVPDAAPSPVPSAPESVVPIVLHVCRICGSDKAALDFAPDGDGYQCSNGRGCTARAQLAAAVAKTAPAAAQTAS